MYLVVGIHRPELLWHLTDHAKINGRLQRL